MVALDSERRRRLYLLYPDFGRVLLDGRQRLAHGILHNDPATEPFIQQCKIRITAEFDDGQQGGELGIDSMRQCG